MLCITGLSAQSKPFEVRVEGEGPPILLLPGFATPGDVWDITVQALSKDFECHVFTYAGFGDVPPVGFPWLPQVKEGISKYIKDTGLQEVTIIGHSMGGTLGLWLASENHPRLSRVMVLDGLPAAGALMIPNYNAETIVYESPWNNQMLEMGPEAFEQMAGQMAVRMTTDPAGQEQIQAWIVAADRETYVYGYTDLLKQDLREALGNIRIPVDILAATLPYGEEAAKITYQTQFAALTDYSLTFAENASHFIMFDQPARLRQWLEDVLIPQE